MPFAANADLPSDVRGRFSEKCQSVFRSVWNDTFARHRDEGRAWATAESAGQACMESAKMTDPIAHKAFTPIEFKLSETGDIMVAFSRFNVIDSDNDVTFPGSMPIGKAVPMSAYGHTSWDGALPTGKGIISERGDLGIFDGAYFMQTDQGRNAYHTTKAMGDIQDWSYGYNPLPPSGDETFEGKRVRALRKLDVFEVSPVLRGAGVGTATLAIKSGGPGPDAPYAEHASWVRDAVKALIDRTQDRADWRAKEGRVLSAANRQQLAAILGAVRGFAGTADELAALLAATEPKAASADPVTLDILVSTAKRLGVTV